MTTLAAPASSTWDELTGDEPLRRFLAACARLLARGEGARARAKAHTWLRRRPNAREGHFVLALAALIEDDLAACAMRTTELFENGGHWREVCDLAAIVYGLAGDLSTSAYWAKLAATVPAEPELVALVPPSVPGFVEVLARISEAPLLARGTAAMGAGDGQRAEHWLRQHLAFDPSSRDAHIRLALCLLESGNAGAAADALRAARHCLPDDAGIASLLARILTRLGNLDVAQALHRWAETRAPDDPDLHAAARLDALVSPQRDAPDLVAEFRRWGERFGVDGTSPRTSHVAPPQSRLTVGLVIAGEGSAPAGQAVADMLVYCDAERFRFVGFGRGQLGDSRNIAYQKCLDRWANTDEIDPATLASIVRGEGIDVLIDLAGFTEPSLLRAFGGRLAPCQASWLNAPLGTGLAGMDFLLTDRFVDADGGGETPYRERPIYFELGCVPCVIRAPISDAGAVRSDGTIDFAADVTLAELQPDILSCWAEILNQVPDATLLLRDHGFRNDVTAQELIARFGNFGVSHRVAIVNAASEHALFAQADVALLAPPMPCPESVSAALSAGIPIVCPAGEGRHRRLAASVLHHLGLGEHTVASTPQAYVDRAVAWAASIEMRSAFRQRLHEQLPGHPVARARARAGDLQAAIERMWQDTQQRQDRIEGKAA